MTNKEFAELLRERMGSEPGFELEAVLDLIDELDPPNPEPGTVVWWRFTTDSKWRIGEVNSESTGIRGIYWNSSPSTWEHIEWKPARILADDEVAVKIPPTHTWGHRVTDVEVVLRYWDVQNNDHEERAHLITRAEAERMERPNDKQRDR